MLNKDAIPVFLFATEENHRKSEAEYFRISSTWTRLHRGYYHLEV